MSRRDDYPAGVPCWVETIAVDVEPLVRFYGELFGWEYARSGPLSSGPLDEYVVARLNGRDVAGIALWPRDGDPPPSPAWNTHIAVDDVHASAALAREAGGTILLEPHHVAPAGWISVVADPDGAVFCLWQGEERLGAKVVNEPSAWAMSLLSSSDPDRAHTFYGRLFGWQADAFDSGDGGRTWLWRRPGYVGGEPEQPVPRDVVAAMMATKPGDGGPPPSWGVDFWTADAGAAAAAAPGLGGRVLAEPFEAGGFRRTVLADPQGAVFSASQLLLPH